MDQIQILNLWKKVKETLQQKYSDLGEAFVALDRNESSQIEYDDWSEELKENHDITSDQTIKQLFDFINTSNSGAITLEEFESKWTQAEQLLKQATNQLKFQQQKQEIKVEQSGQKSVQQFSDLFKSNQSASSPTKYINIQGDFQINHFNQKITPPKQSYIPLNFLDNNKKLSPPKQPYQTYHFLESKKLSLSPPKKTSFLQKSKPEKPDIQQERVRDMQKRITTLFNTKPDPKNSTPRLKKDFDSYLNTMRIGKPNTRRQYSNPQVNFDYQSIFPQRRIQKTHEQRWSFNTRTQASPGRSQDRISLQNYAYQFYDRKLAHRQSFSFTSIPKAQPAPQKTTYWFRL